MRNLKFVSLILVIFLSLQSCVQIFDEIIVHNDGSGTYKYTVNLSASKIKINSVLALDSIDGRRVPKIPEVKEKIALYIKKLEAKEGISNVKVDANYVDFIFKFSCDFTNVAALQEGIREVVKEEVKDKNDPLLTDSWLSWDGKTLTRSIPSFAIPLSKLKVEDQEALKKGKYISVARFDKEVVKSENTQAEISPTKKAVKLEVSAYSVAVKPALLTNEISISAD